MVKSKVGLLMLVYAGLVPVVVCGASVNSVAELFARAEEYIPLA